LSLRDRDLVSIQEARELVALAVGAQEKFAKFSQEQVDAVGRLRRSSHRGG
jgi:hypothetical protein